MMVTRRFICDPSGHTGATREGCVSAPSNEQAVVHGCIGPPLEF